jgi:hypothetical protein
MNTFITTSGGRKQKGVWVPSSVYLEVKTFILSILQKKREVSFHYLLDKAKDESLCVDVADAGWWLIKVKQDLEAREIIIVKKAQGPNLEQKIRLNGRRGRKGDVDAG